MYKKLQPEKITPPRKVLVTSGDSLLCEVMTKVLSRYFGCDVYAAGGTAEATRLLYAGGFDLMVIDLATPKVSGLMLMRKIKNMHPSIPVLVIADIGSDDELAEIAELGINHIIHKPMKVTEFLEIVAGILMESQNIYA